MAAAACSTRRQVSEEGALEPAAASSCQPPLQLANGPPPCAQRSLPPAPHAPPCTPHLLPRAPLPLGLQGDLRGKLSYEDSKYLGGDVAHTHLVKGLDFALLHKVGAPSDAYADVTCL